MDGNQCKTKENTHNNKRKLKITGGKNTYNRYTDLYGTFGTELHVLKVYSNVIQHRVNQT